MNEISIQDLREGCVQLSQLANYFQIPVHRLSAGVVRKASRTLVLSETFFSQILVTQAKDWQRAHQALSTLKGHFVQMDALQNTIAESTKKLDLLRSSLQAWDQLEPIHRQNFKVFHRRCEDVQVKDFSDEDLVFIEKFRRYQVLKPLFNVVNNSSLLQDQLKNFENKEKIRVNVDAAKIKQAEVVEKLKSVTRGFYITLILSFLVVTLPLTLPFLISLWTRKKQIQIQILSVEESLERDEARLRAAEEGELVSHQVRAILGPLNNTELRDLLTEIQSLKDLFLNYDIIKKGALLSVLMFLDHHQKNLESLFETPPSDPVERMAWLCVNMRDIDKSEQLLRAAEQEKEQAELELNKVMKGHNREILKNSIARLEERKSSVLALPMDDEFKAQFSHLCQVVPEILEEVKVTLESLEKGTTVSETAWTDLGRRLSSISNLISACLITLELPLSEASLVG